MQNHDGYWGVPTGSREDSRTIVYNPIFWKRSRYENYENGGFYLSETFDRWSKCWGSMHARGATWGKLRSKENGSALIVLNTHLDHHSEWARIEGSKLITKQLSSFKVKENLPVVMTGDFNSRAWTPADDNHHEYPAPIIPNALPPAGDVYNIYIDYGFLDTYVEAGHTHNLNMNTYHDYYGHRFPPVALRIDWILIWAGEHNLRTIHCDIACDTMTPNPSSDHYPVMAEIEWKPKFQ